MKPFLPHNMPWKCCIIFLFFHILLVIGLTAHYTYIVYILHPKLLLLLLKFVFN